MDIEKKIEQERLRLQGLIEKDETGKKNLEKEKNRLYSEKESATADFYQKIEEISKPFKEKIEAIDGQIESIEKSRHILDVELHNVRIKIKAKHFEKLDEFPDEETFKGYLLLNKIFTRKIVMVKKKLPNGIRLFRHFDTWSSYDNTASKASHIIYFAVFKKKIVGFHHVEKAEHRGDHTTYSSWINVNKPRISNEGYLKFKEWKEKLGELKKFIGVDIADENNKKILSTYWSLPYDAMSDEKKKEVE